MKLLKRSDTILQGIRWMAAEIAGVSELTIRCSGSGMRGARSSSGEPNTLMNPAGS